MKKILFFLLISNYIFAQWSISTSERNALVSLYNSTNGDHWSSPWDMGKDPKTWYGIKTRNGYVTEINLRGNALVGNFPSIFSSFSKLEKLDLSNNQLSGAVSSSINALPNLTRLDISNNRLTGDPSTSLSSLTKLQDLSIGNNELSISNWDSFLQTYPLLKVLDISKFGLTAVPTKLSLLTQLEALNLSNNTIAQNFSTLSGLTKLTELNLSGNKLTVIPSAISAVPGLKILNLSQNPFTGNYSTPLASLTNLEWLSLESTGINAVPTELSQLKNLIHLNLGRNALSGGLSDLLGLTNLEQIFLNNNLLAGNFPTELLQLQKLQMISLSSNNLTGDIPETIPALTFVDNNHFTENQIGGFLAQQKTMADFTYTPQRYDEAITVMAGIGDSTSLPQSLSGENYQFSWLKNLDENINVHTPNYGINHVEEEHFAVYTAEAYFLKQFPMYTMEVSFFREPVTLDNSFSTQEVLKGLSIYPNPTSDYINIKAVNVKIEESYIYDLSGKLILQSKEHSIFVKHLPSGTYLITLKTEKGPKTFKWIKI